MFRDKLKKLLNNQKEGKEENDKKKIENLVIFVVILIITIVVINTIWNEKDKETKQKNNVNLKQLAAEDQNTSNLSNVQTAENLEIKLEEILTKIQGVGTVEVFINYSESSEVVAMYNENSKVSTTEESDTSGGTRKIQETDIQKDIVYEEIAGEKIPITQKVVQPKIEGAIITAKGARDINIKTNIIQAVEAVTGLATHKIQVFEMN